MPIPVYSQASLKLGEAIELFRKTDDPDAVVTESMNSVAQRAFEQHDAVHVIFGLGTSIQDEIAAHVWMALGTTAKISEMHKAVANSEHRKVLSGIGHLKLVGTWLATLPRILMIAFATMRMKKKIAFEELAQLKEMRLSEIRAVHGVVLPVGRNPRTGLRLIDEQDRLRQMKLDELRREVRRGLESGTSEPWDATSVTVKARARCAAKPTAQ